LAAGTGGNPFEVLKDMKKQQKEAEDKPTHEDL